MKLIWNACIFVALAGPAHAASPGNDNIRCMMLSNLFANGVKDAHLREIASEARFYYLGRIADAMTDTQIESALVAAGKTISNASAGAEMTRCAQPMIARAKEMSTISNDLAQHAPK